MKQKRLILQAKWTSPCNYQYNFIVIIKEKLPENIILFPILISQWLNMAFIVRKLKNSR